MPIHVEPYQSQFVPVQVKENPNTTLLVHPQPSISHNSLPFITKVKVNHAIYLPFVNNTKAVKEFKTGTIVGLYEHLDELNPINKEAEVIRNTREIQNDLLPTTDQVNTQGSRSERLAEIIKQQKWNHLTREQRKELNSAILDHNELFILD